jgi:hypothetical protein
MNGSSRAEVVQEHVGVTFDGGGIGGDRSRGERGGAEAESCTLGPAADLPSAPPQTRASSEASDEACVM